MDWKKFLAIPLAALLLFSTACSESAPSEYSRPDGWEESSSTSEETGVLKKMGDILSYRSSYPSVELEITVNGAKVFDSFADSGIPVEETDEGSFAELQGEEYQPPETPFVLVDVTIKEIEGPAERESPDDGLLYTIFSLHSKEQLEYNDDPLLLEPSYFSGHGEQNGSGNGYGYFWMEPGEEKDYQVGFFLRDLKDYVYARDFDPKDYVTSPEQGLVIAVVNSSFREYVDLETDKG